MLTTRRTHEQVPSPPPYEVQVTDLVPRPDRCAWCNRGTVGLHPDLADELRGSAFRGAEIYDRLGGLIRYFSPGFLCEACELDLAADKLVPPVPHVVETDEQKELRELRALLKKPDPTPEPAAVPGALFDVGAVRATREALTLLARAHVPNFDAEVGGAWDRGRAFLSIYLQRHAKGDWGLNGDASEADATRGAQRGPLSSRADRNAAAAAAGKGAVRSVYPVELTQETGPSYARRTVVVGRADLVVWTAPGSNPRTIVALASELPNT